MAEVTHNPKTGQYAVLDGGEWKIAADVRSHSDGRRAYLVGDKWVVDDKPTAKAADAPKPKPLTNDNPGMIDRFILDRFSPQLAKLPDIQGSRDARFIQGLADLPTGAMQLGANLVGLGKPVNERIAEVRKRTESLRGEDANTFDPSRFAGNMLNPVPYKAGAMLPTVTSLGGRVAQGAALGAGLGATTPVENGGDNYFTDKATQAGIGAAVGGVLPVITNAASAAYRGVRNLIDPNLPGGVDRAVGRTLNKAAGADKAEVERLLEENKRLVAGTNPTAAQVAAPARAPAFNALERVAETHDPGPVFRINEANDMARRNAIGNIGKDSKALDAAIENRDFNARENYGRIASTRVNPKSDAQIMEEAIAAKEASRVAALQDQGRFQTMAAQQAGLARGVPVDLAPRQTPNTPYFNVGATGGRAPATVAPDSGALPGSVPFRMQGQLPESRLTANFGQSLEAEGAAKETSRIVAQRAAERDFLKNATENFRNTVGLGETSLNQYLGRPSMQEALKDAAKSAAEKGSYFPSKPGDHFSIENLQRMKESLDAGIKAAKTAADNGRRPELSESELKGTRDALVKWISEKSPAWRDARQQYAADSDPINRMKIGTYLGDKLTAPLGNQERGNMFAQAVRDAPGTIKRGTDNQARFKTLEEAFASAPKEAETIRNVVRDLERNDLSERLAQRGLTKAHNLVGDISPRLPSGGPIDRIYTIVKTVLNRLSGRIEGKTLDAMAKAMETPEGALRAMRAAGVEEKVIDRLFGGGKPNVAATNAAANVQERQ